MDRILIVGAGPVGLSMATELLRHGFVCRIIDKKPGPSIRSKALGIFPRTLEVFDRWGIIDQFLEAGKRVIGLNVHAGSERIAHIDFERLGTPYPFVLVLPQSHTEEILIRHLAARDVPVVWNCELQNLGHFSDTIDAKIKLNDGSVEEIHPDWLIGCDGAHSRVRHELDLDFHGKAYTDHFVLADVELTSSLRHDELHAFFHPDGALALLPIKGDLWRVIIADVPPPNNSVVQPTLADVQMYVDQRGPSGVQLRSPQWISNFRISRRRVMQLRDGNIFLAGDAAHICSPIGGQGMNLGIQDAANLGWKLALVMAGAAADELLESYTLEREPVAADTLQLTDRLTGVVTVENRILQRARNFLLSLLSHISPLQQRFANNLAELDLHYRDSMITMDDSSRGGMRTRRAGAGAGDRAPDAFLRKNVEDAPHLRIFDLLRNRHHVLLLFHDRQETKQLSRVYMTQELQAIRRLAEQQYADQIAAYEIVSRTDVNRAMQASHCFVDDGDAYDRYDVNSAACFLIRPDGYIGYHGSPPDKARFAAYVRGILKSRFVDERREQMLHGEYVMGEGF